MTLTAAHREGGKPKPSSIEEAWETTLLIPQLELYPMWGQMEDSGGCCGVIVTTRTLQTGVSGMESLQSGREKLHIKTSDRAAHLPVCMYLNKIHCAEQRARSDKGKQHRREKGEERRQKEGKHGDKHLCPEPHFRHETIRSLRCPRVCTRLLFLWCPLR